MKIKNQGLYLSEFEHDNCGAGFICSLNGERTNSIIGKALNILTCLEHRGAVSSDGRTGDGAGILIEIPHSFFAKKCNFSLISILVVPLPIIICSMSSAKIKFLR